MPPDPPSGSRLRRSRAPPPPPTYIILATALPLENICSMLAQVMNSGGIFPKLLECGRGIDRSAIFLNFGALSWAEDAVDI